MIRLFLLVTCATLLQWTAARADLVSSRPSANQIHAATQQCRPGDSAVETGVVGLSDPNALDPGVDTLIQETGVGWVRAELHWSRVQSAPGGPYDWAEYDAMIGRFNQAGIRVLAILTYVPPSLQSDWLLIDSEFQRFAAAAVRRYAARGVHHWEVFNEPNLTGYGWLSSSQNARDYLGAYTLLLARANAAVRANDPDGVVVLGGLSGDVNRAIRSEDAMRTVYGHGARDCFDVFAFHPYGYQNKFPAARARMEKIMAAGGDVGKPLWFTEYGWTDHAAMDMARNSTASTNPMMAAFSQRDAASALFWFSAKDYSANRGTPTFGLADFRLRKRPSFATFRHLIEQID